MIEHGLLENPHVDAAFALHVMSNQDSGTLGYTPGIASAAMDTFMIKIKDKGGHTSTPQLCIDPLMIANQLYTTLNLLSCREIDPRETVALSVDECGGGTAVNIIPDTADIKVAARTFNREVTKHLVTRIPEITEHTVKMWRGDYDMIDFHTPSTYNDENLCEELGDVLLQVLLHAQIAKEEGLFTMDDVINGLAEKMIRRHPHVVGDEEYGSDEQNQARWEEIKRQEKEAKRNRKTAELQGKPLDKQ